MLSRTAEYLYWISRYMERAETNARLLDVGYRMSLFPNPNGYNNEWESVPVSYTHLTLPTNREV